MKKEMDNSTIILGDFNTSLLIMNTQTEDYKEIGDLNKTIKQPKFNTSIQHSTQQQQIYILIKCTCNILQDRIHASHKANLNEFKTLQSYNVHLLQQPLRNEIRTQ